MWQVPFPVESEVYLLDKKKFTLRFVGCCIMYNPLQWTHHKEERY